MEIINQKPLSEIQKEKMNQGSSDDALQKDVLALKDQLSDLEDYILEKVQSEIN